MPSQVFKHITYEVERGRARITLNRPEKRNALSIELVEELRAALWEADDDKAVHCVILKGAGTSFCSGYDLTPSRSAEDDGVDRRKGRGMDDDAWHIERFQRCLRTLTEMHKPSIAQIHGHCYAGGTDLALYCDLLICSDTASFGYSALRNMGAAPNQMWLYHIGPQWTKRLLLTGGHSQRRGCGQNWLGFEICAGCVFGAGGRRFSGSFVLDRRRDAVDQQAYCKRRHGADGRSGSAATCS